MFGIASYLILERGKPVPRQRLTRLFWPDRTDRDARHPLRETLRKLRKMEIPITGNAAWEHVTIHRDDVTLDVDHLRHHAATQLAHQDLTLLPTYDPTISDEYTMWLDDTRRTLNATIIQSIATVLRRDHHSTDHSAIRLLAERIVQHDLVHPGPLEAVSYAKEVLRTKRPAPTLFVASHHAPTEHAYVRDTPLTPSPPTLGHPAEQDIPLLGRSHDLATLHNAFRRASDEVGATLTLVGPHGIGKSRLLRDFATALRQKNSAIAGATCGRTQDCTTTRRWETHTTDSPLSLWRTLTPKLLALPGSGGCDPTTKRVLEQFTRQAPEAPTSAKTRSTLRSTLLDLIDAIAYEQPLTLLIDDLERCDTASLALLRTLSPEFTTRAVLLVTTLLGDANTTHDTTIYPLQPLSHATTHEFIAAYRLGIAQHMPADVRDWCIETAQGNPYHAQELVNAWMSSSSEKRLQFMTSHRTTSLSDLIDIRLDDVDALSRRIIQVCAIAGGNATVPLLARTVQTSEWSTAAAVGELRNNGFLTATRHPVADTGYHHIRCRHPLLADRILARTLASEYKTIADAIDRITESQVDDE